MLKLWLAIFLSIQNVSTAEFNIASLFENNKDLEKAFDYAIESCNKPQDGEIVISPLAQNNLEEDDQYLALRETCNLLKEGIVAVVGPRSFSNIEIVQSLCDLKEIPMLNARWRMSGGGGTEINFYPHAPLLSQAYLDIILEWGWITFTAVYEDSESFSRITDLTRRAKDNGIVVDIKQLDPLNTNSYKDAVRDLRASGQQFFVIDCNIENLDNVLKEFQQYGLINEKYNYFLTNLDAHTINLEPYQYSGSNITGIRLINPESQIVSDVTDKFFNGLEQNAWSLKTEQALVIDAVHMFKKALTDITTGSSVPLVKDTNSFPCTQNNSWKHGYSVTNMLKTSTHEGLTGYIKFSLDGFRTDFLLTIFELQEGGISDVGTWNVSRKPPLQLTRQFSESQFTDEYSLTNKSFTVQITLTEPYGMLKESSAHLYGNQRFEGFAVDLIEELAKMEGFFYTFIVRDDKKNGALDKVTGKWSGMIGDLLEHVSDLAITDFTITAEREAVVDFTDPFMSLGISILFKEPQTAPPSFFSFADPFAIDTWIALALAFFIISLSLFMIGRLCADEWTNPYPCIEEPEYLCNQFSLSNSIWFATGSLMCQGSEIAPIAMSTRMVAGMWWFFCLIIVASYTANLAAFLATENPVELFKDLQSLYDNKHDIQYGAKEGGATLNFFLNAEKDTLFWKVGQAMLANPANVKENDEGVRKAENEDYAFFMESTSIEYTTQRHCSLQQYGQPLDEKGYGIAMRKNSTYRLKLNSAILKLQSSGYLGELKRKWWEERKGGGQCQNVDESSDADPLELVSVEGCFWVTIYGTVLAAILVVMEHISFVIKVSKKSKISFREAFMQELWAYLDFNSDVKPVVSKESLDKSKSVSEDQEKNSMKFIKKSKTRSRSRSRSKSKCHGYSKSTSVKSSQTSSQYIRPYGFILSSSMNGLEDNV